jgi:hypothetical protein
MTSREQLMLKEGLRKLLEIGLIKSESKAQNYYLGSKVKEWITIADFKQIFPDSLKFTFTYNGKTQTKSLYDIWENCFIGGVSDVHSKLYDINHKIQTFRNALKDGKNPFEVLIKEYYESVEERFLNDAKVFTDQLIRLMDNNLFAGQYTDKDLVHQWHVYLMIAGFEI